MATLHRRPLRTIAEAVPRFGYPAEWLPSQRAKRSRERSERKKPKPKRYDPNTRYMPGDIIIDRGKEGIVKRTIAGRRMIVVFQGDGRERKYDHDRGSGSGRSASRDPSYEETTELPVFVAKEVGAYLADRVHRLDKRNWYASVKRGMDRGDLPMLKQWRNEASGNGRYLRQLGLNTLLVFGPKPKPQAQPTQMGWWGVAGKHGGSGSYGSSTKLPDPVYSPEEKKLREMIKKLGTVPRIAAGGIVIKSFDVPDVWDLEVIVSKVAPKYGSYFVFPKGGQDLGENIHKTAAREVYEEAGVKSKVANSRSFTTTSRFGDRGKYDLPLVMSLLKKKYPKEADFVEKHKDLVHDLYFTYENTTHYFVMKHLRGRPRQGAGKGHGAAEMAYSEWVTLGEALKRGVRLEKVVKGLFPLIRSMWEKAVPRKKK